MNEVKNYQEHIAHIYHGLLEILRSPFETRVKPVTDLIIYFEKNLSKEAEAKVEDVIKMQQMLNEELIDALHYEKAYDLLLLTFAKARDQLKFNPDSFEGFGDVLEQIPCKASKEVLTQILFHDDISIDELIRLYLAENRDIRRNNK